MKENLKDVTFLMQIRLDSIDRLVNLCASVGFLLNNFDTNIHILEADNFNSELIKANVPSGICIDFIEDHDPVFHRTLYINEMVRKCSTSFISVWEPDVIVPPQQVIKTIDQLRAGESDFVSPYEKNALETSSIIRTLFLKSGDWKVLEKHQLKMKKMYVPNPLGGAFFANREKYIEAGMENLNFYGWGLEDGERVLRWEKLGHRFKRVPGNLYHLTHNRGTNSSFVTSEEREFKMKEYKKIQYMTKEEVEEEISNWNK